MSQFFEAIGAAAAGGLPAGLTTQIQWNNAGAFGASSDFTYEVTTNTISIGNGLGALSGKIRPLPTALGTGGTLTVAAGATANGSGGSLNLLAGEPAVLGAGGDVFIGAGQAVGADQDGGNIQLSVGSPTGAGAPGRLQLTNLTAVGVQAATFAATNKPGVATGAPALWLRVRVGPTIYWVPLFSN